MILPGFPITIKSPEPTGLMTPQSFVLEAEFFLADNNLGYHTDEGGNISREPLSTNTLIALADVVDSHGYIAFSGDVTAILNGLPIYVDGVFHSNLSFSLDDGVSVYSLAPLFGFEDGQFYSITFENASAVTTITAGISGNSEGYVSPSFGGFGSITSDASPGGGTILGILSGETSNTLYLGAGDPSVSSIVLAGVSYPLTFLENAGPVDLYSFGGSTQLIFNGQTYSVELIA